MDGLDMPIELMREANRLQLIMQYGAGLEGIDIDYATSRGIRVSKIPSDTSSNALSCAEHAIFLTLAVFRKYKDLVTSIATGRLGYPSGKTMFGCNAAIIGYGGIGKELVKRLRGFQVKVYLIVKDLDKYHREHVTEFSDVIIGAITIAQWASISKLVDIVYLCCPLTAENRQMINHSFLSELKADAIIVNIARGGLLNYDDVYASLESGHLGGLGLDVYHTEPFPMDISADPILSHPKVVATPHVAGVTSRSYQDMAMIVADNVRRLRDGKPLTGVVNHPS
jgi:phosphoglycerate dehydrogenase-like enzyme